MPSGIHTIAVATSWGDIVVRCADGRVVECTLPHVDETPSVPFVIQQQGRSDAARFIRSVFQGRAATPPPLAVLGGTPFQQKVWRALQDIPKGTTRSYREVAASMGQPRASRAVANACGRNPVPLFIPCHRVIGSDGKLHGFAAGTPWKRLLLTLESGHRIKH
jgi:methylated-DNA-[protein]-cysteine S-methyltransferase